MVIRPIESVKLILSPALQKKLDTFDSRMHTALMHPTTAAVFALMLAGCCPQVDCADDCRSMGRCAPHGLLCEATSQRDCDRSTWCVDNGYCTFDPEVKSCTLGLEKVRAPGWEARQRKAAGL